ncbi:MAG: fumarylacetoacetate hydrolase family protein [bacterium]|nr:fumarylacetoacetate hydrolase family protein [bacterium]
MRFIRYRIGDQAHWGRMEGESVVELAMPPWSDAPKEGRRFLWSSEFPLLPPCEPSKIICVGKNYRAHIKELHPGEDVPQEPLLFLKPPSALRSPGEAILMPPQSERVDYEGELAVVIGKTYSWESKSPPESAIFGYTIANDVTARDLQKKDGQWTRGKGFDTFCPVGPLLRTALPEGATIITRVNDQVRQRATFDQMIFSPVDVVKYVASVMTLQPGDLILTGTPEGVGPLNAGEVVEIEITGIGILSNPVKLRTA